MRRWTKLQSALYNIIDTDIDFQMHCAAYPMRSKTGTGWAPVGNHKVPRYWITIGKEIVWDFPRDCPQEELDALCYPYLYWRCTEILSDVLRAYIDCPRQQLLSFRASPISLGNSLSVRVQDCDLERDRWGLIPILQSCDRRIGKGKRLQIADKILKQNKNYEEAKFS